MKKKKIYLISEDKENCGLGGATVFGTYISRAEADGRCLEMKKLFPQLKPKIDCFNSYIPEIWQKECPNLSNAQIAELLISKKGE